MTINHANTLLRFDSSRGARKVRIQLYVNLSIFINEKVRHTVVIHALIYYQKEKEKEKKDHDDKSDTKERHKERCRSQHTLKQNL
jgi:hypothetical protein